MSICRRRRPQYLKTFSRYPFLDTTKPLDAIPNVSIGGWGGWAYAVGSSLLFKNAFGDTVTGYCLLDRDYYPDTTIEERLAKANAHSVHLHIWYRKENPELSLVPTTISRLIAKRGQAGKQHPSERDVYDKLCEIANDLRDDTCDKIAQQIIEQKIEQGAAAANRKARGIVADAWAEGDKRYHVVPGKDALAALSGWTQKEFNCSLSACAIAREMRREELDPEIARVLTAIERRAPFRPP